MIEFIVGTAITTILALTAYFFQKWLSEVEEKISDIKRGVRDLTEHYTALSQELKSTKFQISKELSELPQIQALSNKIESIERVKEFLRTDFLPKVQENQANYGKITILENRSIDFENRLLKIFKAVELLVQRHEKKAP